MTPKPLREVKPGDVIVFKSYRLRVESVKPLSGAAVHVSGRSDQDGCPLVYKRFLDGSQPVNVE